MPRQISVTLYSASELRDLLPDAFEHALEDHRRMTYDDPAWANEHYNSLNAAIEAFGRDLPDIEGPRRVMAWCENNILAPLRIPWTRCPSVEAGRVWLGLPTGLHRALSPDRLLPRR